MAVSQNGWRADDSSLMKTYTVVPGIRVTLREGDAGVVLLDFLRRYHDEVEPLRQKDLGGYAPRTIRGSASTLSNHASGTAVDCRWNDHPLGARGTFSKAEVAAIRNILADFDGVIRWGGDYSGRKDEMHFEINKGASAVKAVADRIRRNGTSSKVTGRPTPGDGTSKNNAVTPSKSTPKPSANPLRRGDKGHVVGKLQTALNKVFPAYSKLKVDNDFGKATEAVVKEFQRRAGLKADGIVGDATRAALRKHGVIY